MQTLTEIFSSSYFLFALTGIISGFLSGLLSIGGGFILVPALIAIFTQYYNFEPHYAIQLILGTTMSCMIFTAVTSTFLQNKKGAIYWEYISKNWLFILAGTIAGVIITGFTSVLLIKLIFGAFCIYSGLKMIFKKLIVPHSDNCLKKSQVPSFMFGSLCGLIGVGGANVVVPFLLKRGIELRRALGTASAFQVLVSIVGTVSYLTMGLVQAKEVQVASGAIGYIFIPALVMITVFAIGFNKLGVSIAHSLPVDKLKKYFGVFTFLVGAKMLMGLV